MQRTLLKPHRSNKYGCPDIYCQESGKPQSFNKSEIELSNQEWKGK
jgi:hypothetical protein